MDFVNRNHIIAASLAEVQAHLYMSDGKHVVLDGSKEAIAKFGEALLLEHPMIRLSDGIKLNFREITAG